MRGNIRRLLHFKERPYCIGCIDPDGDYSYDQDTLKQSFKLKTSREENDHEAPDELLPGRPRHHQSARALEAQIQASGLDKSLIELVKTRASQINGCAFCINMHTQDARKQGETEQRLYLLSAWRESPLYTDRERAALAWTEAVTLIAETHAPDDLYEDVRAHFSEAETVNLTMLIGAINAWNRIAIAFRAVHPVKAKAAVA